ncbi:MAG: hypothetical protein QM813_07345 [Verrucomicrobiota bacterium]
MNTTAFVKKTSFAAFATLGLTAGVFAGVTVTTDTTGPSVWPGEPLIRMSAAPGDATVQETFTLGGGCTNLAQTFVAPTDCTLYGLSVVNQGGVENLALNLYDLGVALSTPNSVTDYNALITGANLLGGGVGLPFTSTAFSGAGIHHFEFDNVGTTDRVTLLSNHLYAVEIIGPLGSANFWWNRTASDPYTGGSTFRDRTAHRSDRDFGFAIYTSVTNSLGETLPITYNPAGSAYGPPPTWAGNPVISILPTGAGYTSQAFGNPVIGETFVVTNALKLAKVSLAGGVSGGGTGWYRLHVYNLGAGGTWATYGNSFNPSSYADVLKTSTIHPTNLTQGILQVELPANNQPVLTNGNYMFALEFVTGTGNNNFIWQRTGGGTVYTEGAGYYGTMTGVTNSSFGGGVRTMIMALEPFYPQIQVTNGPVDTTWPGNPVVRTFENPALPDAGTRVPENFDSPAGRVVSMAFIPTNNFNLGAVAIRGTGGGSTNAFYRASLYHITNFTGYPANYRPSTEATNLLRNLSFQIVNGSANDFILMLQFTNALDHVSLQASNVYAFEISRDPADIGAATFYWIRGSGGISTYDPYPGELPTPRGYEVNAGGTAPYYGAANLRTPLAGSIRDLVMAVYAAPEVLPSISITNVTHAGTTTTLTWTSSAGAIYSVERKASLTDATWLQLVTGLASGGASTSYTDTTATNAASFYRVSTP